MGTSMASYGPMDELASVLSGGFAELTGAGPTGVTGNPTLDGAIENLATRLSSAAQALARMSNSAATGVQTVTANYRSADLV